MLTVEDKILLTDAISITHRPFCSIKLRGKQKNVCTGTSSKNIKGFHHCPSFWITAWGKKCVYIYLYNIYFKYMCVCVYKYICMLLRKGFLTNLLIPLSSCFHHPLEFLVKLRWQREIVFCSLELLSLQWVYQQNTLFWCLIRPRLNPESLNFKNII